MKEVTIKIIGKHIHDGVEEDQLELVTEAKMYEKNGILYIFYDESEFTGLEGVKTRLRVEGDSLKLTRSNDEGAVDSGMFFEKGKRYEDKYNTPMGPVSIEILTNELENTLSYDGTGRLFVDYSISLKGLAEGRSKLDIEFMGEI